MCCSNAYTSFELDFRRPQKHVTHRTLSPGLERAIKATRSHFDWNVLVTTEWSDNLRPVSKLDQVVWSWRKEALQNSYGTIKDRSAFTASLGMHNHLIVLHEVSMDALDVRRGRGVQVRRSQIAAKLI
jgi:hypothetical protein